MCLPWSPLCGDLSLCVTWPSACCQLVSRSFPDQHRAMYLGSTLLSRLPATYRSLLLSVEPIGLSEALSVERWSHLNFFLSLSWFWFVVRIKHLTKSILGDIGACLHAADCHWGEKKGKQKLKEFVQLNLPSRAERDEHSHAAYWLGCLYLATLLHLSSPGPSVQGMEMPREGGLPISQQSRQSSRNMLIWPRQSLGWGPLLRWSLCCSKLTFRTNHHNC